LVFFLGGGDAPKPLPPFAISSATLLDVFGAAADVGGGRENPSDVVDKIAKHNIIIPVFAVNVAVAVAVAVDLMILRYYSSSMRVVQVLEKVKD